MRRPGPLAEVNYLPAGCSFNFQDLLDNVYSSYVGDVGISINPKRNRCLARLASP